MYRELFWMMLVIPALMAVALAVIFSMLKSPAQAGLERRRQMRKAAERLGFHFYASGGEEVCALLPRFGLMRRVGIKTVSNLMGERRRPPRHLAFDVQCGPHRLPGVSDPTLCVLHQVAMVQLAGGPQVGPVMMFRDDWFGGPIGVSGLYRLEFEEDPVFSTSYSLSGEHADRVRRVLTPAVREAVKAWNAPGPRPVVEVLPEWVVVYVEADHYDRGAGRRCQELLLYAAGIAASVQSVPCGAGGRADEH